MNSPCTSAFALLSTKLFLHSQHSEVELWSGAVRCTGWGERNIGMCFIMIPLIDNKSSWNMSKQFSFSSRRGEKLFSEKNYWPRRIVYSFPFSDGGGSRNEAWHALKLKCLNNRKIARREQWSGELLSSGKSYGFEAITITMAASQCGLCFMLFCTANPSQSGAKKTSF